MTGSIPPPNPLAYEGQVVVPFIMRDFDPQTTFNKFPVPTIWINSATSKGFMLVSKALGSAFWLQLGAQFGNLDTLTTPDSTVVVPTGGNINFLQSGSISITGSGSDITFTVTGGGIGWIEATNVSTSLSVNTGYVVNNNALVTLTLPTTASVGDVIQIVGKGVGGWKIAQNAGQKIYFGKRASTTGITGYIASTSQRDCVTMVCVTDNIEFQVVDSIGDITYI